ncbi:MULTISPECIES: adenylyl-sulfate kinase [Actinosynnema]|uniref:adenylyl-sulfate kinase n=1 Tax=Actinosynnema TaxID=40566 RepID=UPI0027E26E7B|nr:adenylyl-sulfate kinase [Actinosynnema pretiosum]MCP2098737.1 adenylylsulfate kinase [Actinosynnema pretiosum]
MADTAKQPATARRDPTGHVAAHRSPEPDAPRPGSTAPEAPAPGSTAARPPEVLSTARGATVWFTGLPSSGKSTLARAVAARVSAGRVEVLDGDEVRRTLSAGLGFSRTDREINIERIGFVADLLARNGVLVLAAVISPYRDARARVRDRHRADGAPFFEVHVATPVERCAARDVKGLYARQRAGELTGLTGVDDVYEEPAEPELRLGTEDDVARTADRVVALLVDAGVLR